MLVGHYIKEEGFDVHYYDEQTGDIPRSIRLCLCIFT